MHQIILYEDRNGVKPVDEYLKELDSQNTKDARIRRGKDPRIRQNPERTWIAAS